MRQTEFARTVSLTVTLLPICLLLCVSVSFAAIPRLINYQGRLTDSGGAPLNGSYSVTFRIYDAQSGGTFLWQETQSVVIQNGIFNTILGSSVDLNIPFDNPYFLELKIGSEVMSPRQRITSSGYAIRAEVADTALTANSASVANNADTAATVKGNNNIFNGSGNIGIGTLTPQAGFQVNTTVKMFGSWEQRALETTYYASSDGFVIGYLGGSDAGYTYCTLLGYTDGNSSPFSVRGATTFHYAANTPGSQYFSFCMPVKRGDYWRVVRTNFNNDVLTKEVYWLPLGQ
ncbi:MAG: hypothetical protein ABH858_04795 [Candidatus Omnitrophota bacterium]